MKPHESSLKSKKSAEIQHVHSRGRDRGRKKRIKDLSKMAVELSHENQVPLKKVIGELEKQILIRVLKEVGASQVKAARILGMKYTTLNEKLRHYGIRIKRISKIVLYGFFLFWCVRALTPDYKGLVKKAREGAELTSCQHVVRLPAQTDLQEPEKSVAAAIQLHKSAQDRFSYDNF
jgi:DNA-binding protein Fis